MSLITDHILTWVTFFPLLGSLLLWTVIRRDSHARIFALGVALVDFVLSLHLWFHFDSGNGNDQFVEKVAWLFNGQVSYHLGMDGISLVLVMLTTFLGPLIILSTWKAIKDRVPEFMGFILFLQAAMLGTFFARDMLLFYVFWEAMLIPMYFIIGIWGGQRRIYAAVKFFIFTMVGSVFMLVGILYLYFQAGSMNLTDFLNVSLSHEAQLWLFAAFFLAFAIKVPVFPLHTWLPDAHVEAPTAGSVVLAGVLLKMGTYGMLRFAMPLFPDGVEYFAPAISILAVIGIIYGALVAMVQPDVKKLVAYSSVSHLGFVVLGLFSLTPLGVAGGIFTMLAHGLSTGALFLLVGVIYERRHTRQIADFGGLAHGMPVYATFFMIATLASVGLPGMAGFIGEFLILFGTFGSETLPHARLMVVLAATGVVLGAIYMLWMYQRVFFGKLSNEKNQGLPDLSLREVVVLLPIVIFMFWLGVQPGLILDKIETSVAAVLAPLNGGGPSSMKIRPSCPPGRTRIRNGNPGLCHPEHGEPVMNEFFAPNIGGQLGELLPYLIVAVGGLLVMVVDSFVRTLKKDHLSYLTMFILIAAVIVQIVGKRTDGEVLGGMMIIGDFTRFFNYLFAGIGVMTTIFATGLFDREGKYRPEFYPLLLFSTLGMMVLVASNDLLTIFLGLETMSLATYILVGGVRGDIRSSEAGFKYLILGGFSSAFLLMGMALIYGFAGGTGFGEISAALGSKDPDVLIVGLGSALMLVGFGFKVAMVPFHMWTPDVYAGAPSYVTGFMATAIKAAGIAILVRFAILMQPQLAFAWYPVLTVLAVVTMSMGNLVALAQNNIKRMLAWSSVAHAGYLLLGVVTMISPPAGGSDMMMLSQEVGESAGAAILFYLVGYSLMNLAAFGIINVMSHTPGSDADDINGYAGLSRRQPLAAATLGIALLSLAGIPPFVGFMAKFYLFSAVVRAGLIPLAIIGVINSLISVYYYLRVLVVMYMKEPDESSYRGTELVSVVTAGVLALLVIWLGVMPEAFHRAALIIFRQFQF